MATSEWSSRMGHDWVTKSSSNGYGQRRKMKNLREVAVAGSGAGGRKRAATTLQCETTDLKKVVRWQRWAVVCKQQANRCYSLLKATLITAIDQRRMCIG
ncbi:hypothetical protein BHE74_00028537 [Ensete ventricosum]|nr:hypothetical protein BHE74_00028537 [Ensete ventricosum]